MNRFRRPDQGDRITRRDCDVEALAVLRGFAVDDLAKAKPFYGPTLGVFGGARAVADMLSLAAVDQLRTAGVEFEQTTKAPSRRTRSASPPLDRSKPGSGIRPKISCR
jgi:hypothetical protein